MRAQRLSYETAGAAVPTHGSASSALRAVPPARLRSLPVPPTFGRSPTRNRQRRLVIAAMLAAHAVAVLGLMNASRLRDAVAEARPVFLAVVETPATTAPPRPLPTPPSTQVPPPPQLTLPLVAPDLAPAPSPMVAQVLQPPPLPAPVAPVEAPPVPAPSIAPKTIPASAIQYIVPATPVYSRISARLHESGKAVVRVWIDEAGMPRNVQLVQSTGFSRLDEATLTAVRNCRFKPYLENGVAVAAWAVLPFEFELTT